jgi:choline dehydrogenase
MGGTSAVNGAIALRGIPQDYDGWAKLGNDEWDWSSVLPYFIRLEDDEDFGDQPYHGDSGPIPIARSRREHWPTAVQAFGQAFLDRGFPACADHNAPESTGFGPTPRNKVGRHRASTSVTYVARARTRPNLHVRSDTLVTRVLLEGSRAVGVEVEQRGVREQLLADRVVLSGGAINTPQILMLSGIGPRDVLERVGIPVHVELPGVGRNLQDHPFIPLVFVATDTEESRYGFLTQLRYSSGAKDSPPQDFAIFPAFIATSSMNFDTDSAVHGAIMANAILAKPKAAGWIDLASADPSAHPVLYLNFLGEDIDVVRMTGAVRMLLEIVGSEPVASQVGAPLLAPDAETAANDHRLLEWMRLHVTTSFHCAGTCRMGPEGDQLAVLDQRLRVRGVDGLYVGDASIMPSISTGFTNLPAYMIGERLADWLRGDD